MRIGRTTAYELVHRDYVTGGAEGLGVVRIGGQFRMPRAALERLIGGPVSWPDDTTTPWSNAMRPSPCNRSSPTSMTASSTSTDQPQLRLDV